MYIKIRNAGTGQTVMINNLSKLDNIDKVKQLVSEKMKVEHGKQRLLFQGKQLEDSYSLYDYDVKVNDIIQLIVRAEKEPLGESQADNIPKSVDSPTKKAPKVEAPKEVTDATSEHYKVDDKIDCRDADTGAWFEAIIKKVTANDSVKGIDNLTYHIKYEGYEEDMLECHKVKLEQLRPRAKTNVKFVDLDLKHEIMVNYNLESPEERGFWYDAVVTGWRCTSSVKSLVVTIKATKEVPSCQIKFLDECFKPEAVKYATASNLTASIGAGGDKCTCNGKPEKKCKKCGCRICGGKDDPNNQIMCDECDAAYHLKCLGMKTLPDVDEWFCPLCKNEDDIVGGSKQMAKKKVTGNNRDWGKGFACQGRNKVCTKVAKNHFGPIPGIGVGQQWLMRIQVSEEGVHRPPVGGIAGTAKDGCQSIVLAGGYEDDEDNGDYFTYTGSGGRDLSGNKRTAEQSSDQKLDKSNAAIARNCKVSFNPKDGGDAGDKWREGKPIRVVRNYKGRKHSKYAPEEGNRYDGIYKVVKYWPEKGKSGFIVWRYMLRRDDPTPAPWTEEGKKRIEEEGYEMIYPPGYLEAEAEKLKNGATPKGKRKRTSSQDDENDEDFIDDEEAGDDNDVEDSASPAAKKQKSSYKISKEWLKLMDDDTENKNLWEQVKSQEAANKKELLDYIEELFCCIICQDIVFKPVTTPCKHNFCLSCLERSFASTGKFECSSCRADLGKDYEKPVNTKLKAVLNVMFPGYEVGR